jgi:hypothetical protein
MKQFIKWFEGLCDPTTADGTLKAIAAVGANAFYAAVNANVYSLGHEETIAFEEQCARLAKNVAETQTDQDKKDWGAVAFNLNPSTGNSGSGRIQIDYSR